MSREAIDLPPVGGPWVPTTAPVELTNQTSTEAQRWTGQDPWRPLELAPVDLSNASKETNRTMPVIDLMEQIENECRLQDAINAQGGIRDPSYEMTLEATSDAVELSNRQGNTAPGREQLDELHGMWDRMDGPASG